VVKDTSKQVLRRHYGISNDL